MSPARAFRTGPASRLDAACAPRRVHSWRPQRHTSRPGRRQAQQARRASRLEHPHLVSCFDLGEDARGRIYLVRELAETSLAERLQAGPLPLEQARELVSQLAEAVAYAREEGVAPVGLDPRDVVYSQGLPKLADLGLVHAHRGLGPAPDARADARALGAAPPAGVEFNKLSRADRRAHVLGLIYKHQEQQRGRQTFF